MMRRVNALFDQCAASIPFNSRLLERQAATKDTIGRSTMRLTARGLCVFAEGKQICVDFIAQLAEIPGVAGAHIMAPNNESAIPDVIAKARKTVTNRALAS